MLPTGTNSQLESCKQRCCNLNIHDELPHDIHTPTCLAFPKEKSRTKNAEEKQWLHNLPKYILQWADCGS